MRCLCICLACCVTALLPAAIADGPWSDVWTMPLRGEERTFVDHQGTSYLVIGPADLALPDFIDGKDVMLPAQFERQQGRIVHCFGLPPLRVLGRERHFDGTRFGDNIRILGRLDAGGDLISCRVAAVIEAPSDQDLLAERLAAIAPADFPARLAAAERIRSEAARRGNRDLWIETAQRVVERVVHDAAARAATEGDLDLHLQAMAWAVDLLADDDLAGRLAAAAWLQDIDQLQRNRVERFMHGLGYIAVEGGWVRQGAALMRSYHRRLDALDWQDADAHYELAHWIDSYGDVLPRAEELRHQALQAGLRVDPEHDGIRRALGLPPTGMGSAAISMEVAYRDEELDITIPGPAGWERHEEPIGGVASWGAPDATRFCTVDVLHGETAPAAMRTWTAIELTTLSHRPDFTSLEPPEGLDLPSTIHLEVCTFTGQDDERYGLLALMLIADGSMGLRFWCNGLADHTEAMDDAFIPYLREVAAMLVNGDPASNPPGDDAESE